MKDASRLSLQVTLVEMLGILQNNTQYRAIIDSIFALPGLSCFQRGRVNMFPVSPQRC
jgi:hypothetical protein